MTLHSWIGNLSRGRQTVCVVMPPSERGERERAEAARFQSELSRTRRGRGRPRRKDNVVLPFRRAFTMSSDVFAGDNVRPPAPARPSLPLRFMPGYKAVNLFL